MSELTMTFIYRACILLTVFLFISCGGSSNDTTTNAPNTSLPSSSNALVPSSFSNTELTMVVDNLPSEGLGLGFPTVNNTLVQAFGDYSITYLQSDDYMGWAFDGAFSYTLDGNDTANIVVNITDTRREYALQLNFSDQNSGTWQGQFNDGNLVLNGTFTLQSTPEQSDYPYTGTIEEEQDITSSFTNRIYKYQVFLPAGYSASNDPYPVFYVTDGQWEYWKVAHAIETSELSVILVAIAHDPAEERLIDFDLPESHHFLAFLKDEMLPLIESQYHIDPTQRGLAGSSWGGLLIRHALISDVDDPLFTYYFSADGSYWNKNNDYIAMERAVYGDNSLQGRKLYLSGVTRGGNDIAVNTFYSTLLGYENLGLSILHQTFEVEHEQSVNPSMREALQYYFMDD